MLALVAVLLAGCAIPWERYYADKVAWDAGWYAINDGPLCGHRYDPQLSWEVNSRHWDECTAALKQYVADHPQPVMPYIRPARPNDYLVM
jgi:hypothetical protein